MIAPAPEPGFVVEGSRIRSWNNSALRTLQECGEKFRRKYLEREWTPATPRQLRGTVVHRVATHSLLRKLRERTLPSVEEARDLAATEFDRRWGAGVTLSRDERTAGPSVAAESKDFAVDLSGYHVRRLAPVITPIGVERQIIVRPQDSDLEIHGTIDLIDQGAAGEVIRDLKTSEKSPPEHAAATSQQLTMYGMIRLAEVGRLPARFALDYLVRTPKRHEQKHVPQETTRTPDDIRALVARLNTAVEAVRRGVFVPANQESWWCSPTYCEYFATCPYPIRASRPAN